MTGSARLTHIQILRAIAAITVAVGHTAHEAASLPKPTPAAQSVLAYTPLFDWAFGVDVFFVISGFIMLHTTGDQFAKPGAALRFFSRRLARIAPLYWLMTLLFFAIARLAPNVMNSQPEGLSDLFLSLFFVPFARSTGLLQPILGLGWTLNYEMFFYLLFAACLTFPYKQGLAVLALVFLTLPFIGALWTTAPVPIQFWTNSIVLEFLMGVAIAALYRSQWHPSSSLSIALLALCAGLVLLFITPPLGLPRFVTLGLPAACFVFAAVFAPEPTSGWAIDVARALGDASYSIYLSHMYSLRFFRLIWCSLTGGMLSDWWFMAAGLVWVCALGYALYALVEVPLTRAVGSALAIRAPSLPVSVREAS